MVVPVVPADDDVDLVAADQALDRGLRLLGIDAHVVVDQFQLAADHATRGVDLFDIGLKGLEFRVPEE